MEQKIILEASTDKIINLLEEKQYFKAKDELLNFNPVDISEILEEILETLGIEIMVILFRMLPKDVAVEVFSYLDGDDQKDIVSFITDKEISYIIEELDFDDKIDALEELPANIVDKILENTPKKERKLINTFLNYPDTCAGSLMTPDYISLEEDMTVGEALSYIKKEGIDSETIYTCYVKEKGRKLKGIVSLRALVVNDDNTKVSEIMQEEYVYVNVYDDQEDVSESFKKYGFLAIPVVDRENRLVGIITVDDILGVIEEETTEDIERMAGVIDNTDRDYLDVSVFSHIKNRFPWLFLLMCSYMLTGYILGTYEDVMQNNIVLMIYLPMLMGTGGNSGAQSATLVIRALALDDVDLSDTLKVIWKEFRVSFVIGLALSLINFGRIVFIENNGIDTGLIVSLSMIIVVVAAKLIGALLPLLAKKIGIDPALMATPLISSLTDMVSIFTYFSLAILVL